MGFCASCCPLQKKAPLSKVEAALVYGHKHKYLEDCVIPCPLSISSRSPLGGVISTTIAFDWVYSNSDLKPTQKMVDYPKIFRATILPRGMLVLHSGFILDNTINNPSPPYTCTVPSNTESSLAWVVLGSVITWFLYVLHLQWMASLAIGSYHADGQPREMVISLVTRRASGVSLTSNL